MFYVSVNPITSVLFSRSCTADMFLQRTLTFAYETPMLVCLCVVQWGSCLLISMVVGWMFEIGFIWLWVMGSRSCVASVLCTLSVQVWNPVRAWWGVVGLMVVRLGEAVSSVRVGDGDWSRPARRFFPRCVTVLQPASCSGPGVVVLEAVRPCSKVSVAAGPPPKARRSVFACSSVLRYQSPANELFFWRKQRSMRCFTRLAD